MHLILTDGGLTSDSLWSGPPNEGCVRVKKDASTLRLIIVVFHTRAIKHVNVKRLQNIMSPNTSLIIEISCSLYI